MEGVICKQLSQHQKVMDVLRNFFFAKSVLPSIVEVNVEPRRRIVIENEMGWWCRREGWWRSFSNELERAAD